MHQTIYTEFQPLIFVNSNCKTKIENIYKDNLNAINTTTECHQSSYAIFFTSLVSISEFCICVLCIFETKPIILCCKRNKFHLYHYSKCLIVLFSSEMLLHREKLHILNRLKAHHMDIEMILINFYFHFFVYSQLFEWIHMSGDVSFW